MRTILCIALISTLSAGVSPQADAVPSQGSVLAAKTMEIPLIPLEKSLIPLHRSVESSRSRPSRPKDNLTLANTLIRGLLVANRSGEIAYSDPISYKVQNVVRSLRRGDALGKARKHAGVSSRVVHRLLKLGADSSVVN